MGNFISGVLGIALLIIFSMSFGAALGVFIGEGGWNFLLLFIMASFAYLFGRWFNVPGILKDIPNGAQFWNMTLLIILGATGASAAEWNGDWIHTLPNIILGPVQESSQQASHSFAADFSEVLNGTFREMTPILYGGLLFSSIYFYFKMGVRKRQAKGGQHATEAA